MICKILHPGDHLDQGSQTQSSRMPHEGKFITPRLQDGNLFIHLDTKASSELKTEENEMYHSMPLNLNIFFKKHTEKQCYLLKSCKTDILPLPGSIWH